MFRQHASPGIPIMLVGTKADIVDQDALAMIVEEAEAMTSELDLRDHITTSSKTGLNVQEDVAIIYDGVPYK